MVCNHIYMRVTHTQILPWVTRFLWSASLQLLHQHLAAPSQGVTDLPEGAAAAQRPITVLREEEKEKRVSIHWRRTLHID